MAVRYNVDFINPFLEAVIGVSAPWPRSRPSPANPTSTKRRTAPYDVTGIIGIDGHCQGTIALSLSKDAILKIVNNMLSENLTEIDEDIRDAVGELTNMIAGQARASLATIGMKFNASTPLVSVGQARRPPTSPAPPILAIPSRPKTAPGRGSGLGEEHQPATVA
jgi:chemotaxis protein CheX